MIFGQKKKEKLKVYRCCEMGCERFFRSASDLKEHKEKGYHCAECGFGFDPSVGPNTRPAYCLGCLVDKAYPDDSMRKV